MLLLVLNMVKFGKELKKFFPFVLYWDSGLNQVKNKTANY